MKKVTIYLEDWTDADVSANNAMLDLHAKDYEAKGIEVYFDFNNDLDESGLPRPLRPIKK